MGDSSACEWFSLIFRRLAKEPERNREIARFVYGVTHEIDFHPCELELDEELMAWGLAKEGPNPDEPTEAVLYLGVDYGEYPDIWEDLE